MARILVVSEQDPNVMVEMVERDHEDGGVDGACTGCGYTVSQGGIWFSGFEDMLREAENHIDRKH